MHGTGTIRACLIALVALIAGCGTPTTSQRSMVFVDPPQAQDVMNSRRGILGLGGERSATWLDPRSPDAFARGHIAGAINLPFGRVTTDHETVLAGYDLIIVYGDDYNDPIAEAMSKRLLNLGYKDVRTLRGGLRQWTNEGFELEVNE
jgi:3-mercaptopyruvate sulfurtransferase SseA